MKSVLASIVLFGLAAGLAACGGSDSKKSTTPAATSAATTVVSGTTPAATKAAQTAVTGTTVTTGSGDCKYLTQPEATALLSNAGTVKVNSADTPAAKQMTCSWGPTPNNKLVIIVSEVKISAAMEAIKQSLKGSDVKTIDGLGDGGAFETKTDTAVSVVFYKGNTQVAITVSGTGLNADAVAAAAKKIAGRL